MLSLSLSTGTTAQSILQTYFKGKKDSMLVEGNLFTNMSGKVHLIEGATHDRTRHDGRALTITKYWLSTL